MQYILGERRHSFFSLFFPQTLFQAIIYAWQYQSSLAVALNAVNWSFFSPIHRTHMKLLLIVCFIATLWLLDSFRHVLGACDGLHGIFGEFLSPKKISCYLFCSLSKVIYFSEILSHFGLFFIRSNKLTYNFCADLLFHILTMLCFLFF